MVYQDTEFNMHSFDYTYGCARSELRVRKALAPNNTVGPWERSLRALYNRNWHKRKKLLKIVPTDLLKWYLPRWLRMSGWPNVWLQHRLLGVVIFVYEHVYQPRIGIHATHAPHHAVVERQIGKTDVERCLLEKEKRFAQSDAKNCWPQPPPSLSSCEESNHETYWSSCQNTN